MTLSRAPGSRRGTRHAGRGGIGAVAWLAASGCTVLPAELATHGAFEGEHEWAAAHALGPASDALRGGARSVARGPPAPARRVAETTVSADPPPFVGYRPRDFDAKILYAPAELGTASIGEANRGALLNGVAFPPGPLWVIAHADRSFGTAVVVETASRAVARVNEQFPGTARLFVGDISALRGGYLHPHRSHQNGRDIDLGYYYLDQASWYVPATADNLDRPRSWALVEALIAEGYVEVIFMDELVQALLADHALRSGEDPAWVEAVFGGPRVEHPIVKHTWGHRTHLHVRVHDALAEERGRRLYPHLLRHRRVR